MTLNRRLIDTNAPTASTASTAERPQQSGGGAVRRIISAWVTRRCAPWRAGACSLPSCGIDLLLRAGAAAIVGLILAGAALPRELAAAARLIGAALLIGTRGIAARGLLGRCAAFFQAHAAAHAAAGLHGRRMTGPGLLPAAALVAVHRSALPSTQVNNLDCRRPMPVDRLAYVALCAPTRHTFTVCVWPWQKRYNAARAGDRGYALPLPGAMLRCISR